MHQRVPQTQNVLGALLSLSGTPLSDSLTAKLAIGYSNGACADMGLNCYLNWLPSFLSSNWASIP